MGPLLAVICVGAAGAAGAYLLDVCNCRKRPSNEKKTETDQPLPNTEEQKKWSRTKPNISKPRPKDTHFKAHIAIDFGTAGCGLAFAYDGEVEVYGKFRGRGRSRTTKTKTCILLNERNEVSGFGGSAQLIYEQSQDKAKKEWKYFQRFKMALYESAVGEEKRNTDIDIKDSIKAVNGLSMKSEKVFVAAFEHLCEEALKYLGGKMDLKPEDIQWILTVPAIWSDKSKDKMKQWISKAGYVNPSIHDQCIIVYEPDCASLAIQKEYFDGNNEGQKRFNEGEKYILVDAGGGTVDIACHQITANGDVEEIYTPSGGAWGGCYVDDLYIILLEEIFSKEWLDEFKIRDASKYLEIVHYFQDAKKRFEGDTEEVPDIELPLDFLLFLEEKCSKVGDDTTPESIVGSFKKPLSYYRTLFETAANTDVEETKTNESMVQIKLRSEKVSKWDDSREYIELECSIWRELFNSKINPILAHVDKLWNIEGMKGECNYLCLVGGFSGSDYLQSRMKRQFGEESKYKMKVIIPSDPILAVVIGAAWMGITKNYIAARRLKFTYGINLCFSAKKAQRKGISLEYIKKNTAKDGTVKNCFKVIASKNDRVALGDVKKNKSMARSTTSILEILCSDKKEPKTKADGISLGRLVIPDTKLKEETITEFHFYGTMFNVYSYPKNNKDSNRKKEIKIDYQQ